jgi:uncharacterized protein (TIGR00369 family)
MTEKNVAELMIEGNLQGATEQARRDNTLHDLMALSVIRHDDSATALTMELTESVRGSAEGTVHGGMLATLADVAAAFSLSGTYDAQTLRPVTTDMHIRYYRQPRSGPILAEARIVHKGRRLLSVESSVTDAEERVLARATATYMLVPQGG